MSAAFDFAGQVHWGTNGSIEAYLDALATIAAERFGVEDPLAVALRREREQFYSGAVVFLDTILNGAEERARFVAILDAATSQLLLDGGFTDIGVKWVETEVRGLRERIARHVPPEDRLWP